jgi:hypothetical protein
MTIDDTATTYSGVRVATSTRGFDISVHAYVGCSREQMEAAGDLAMDEYMRVFMEMKRRVEAGFLETVKAMKA